jgi:hypothetical protein
MSEEATGIPTLRAHALILTAPGIWKTVLEQLESKDAVLARSLKIWADNALGEHRADLLDIACELQSSTLSLFDGITGKQHDLNELHLYKPIRTHMKKSQEAGLTALAKLTGGLRPASRPFIAATATTTLQLAATMHGMRNSLRIRLIMPSIPAGMPWSLCKKSSSRVLWMLSSRSLKISLLQSLSHQ